jgi:serine phosphatase RsbU (regulator of sigma subunit)
VAEDSPRADQELARLRAETDEQQREIARLHDEATEEAEGHRRRERALAALVERLRTEARLREDVIARQLKRLAADDVELNDLRAIRDALTPPELARQPGVDVAASFVPATEGVSGDFHLIAEGPHETTTLLVGDVVGKGLDAARRAAFVRTVLSTAAPFSDDPAQLLSWANTALLGRTEAEVDLVTVGCVTFSPSERRLRWAYAGHPPVLALDSGEELPGGRAFPLGVSPDWACTTASDQLAPGAGVLLYTDGVTEARRDGELFGQARLARSVQRTDGQPPADVVAAVMREVEGFAGGGLADDLCVVAARIDDGP